MDVIVTHPGTEKFIRNMNWKDKDQYNVAGRDIWRVEGRVSHTKHLSSLPYKTLHLPPKATAYQFTINKTFITQLYGFR